jgi:hypothetical protein
MTVAMLTKGMIGVGILVIPLLAKTLGIYGFGAVYLLSALSFTFLISRMSYVAV